MPTATRSRTHARAAAVLAAGVLVLSLAGPISAGLTTEAKLALSALHVIVGTTLIGLLGRTATR